MEIIEISEKCDETNTEYYSRAADYWQNVTPTIDGMLGGFAKISHTDIDGVKQVPQVPAKRRQ